MLRNTRKRAHEHRHSSFHSYAIKTRVHSDANSFSLSTADFDDWIQLPISEQDNSHVELRLPCVEFSEVKVSQALASHLSFYSVRNDLLSHGGSLLGSILRSQQNRRIKKPMIHPRLFFANKQHQKERNIIVHLKISHIRKLCSTSGALQLHIHPLM